LRPPPTIRAAKSQARSRIFCVLSSPPVPPGAVWITVGQLRVRYGGMSNAWVDQKILNDPAFPKPHYFGSKLRFFNLSEVEAFERHCAAVDIFVCRSGGAEWVSSF
jgi:predicted DNA-binding transcriptional regulator AlpA